MDSVKKNLSCMYRWSLHIPGFIWQTKEWWPKERLWVKGAKRPWEEEP